MYFFGYGRTTIFFAMKFSKNHQVLLDFQNNYYIIDEIFIFFHGFQILSFDQDALILFPLCFKFTLRFLIGIS